MRRGPACMILKMHVVTIERYKIQSQVVQFFLRVRGWDSRKKGDPGYNWRICAKILNKINKICTNSVRREGVKNGPHFGTVL